MCVLCLIMLWHQFSYDLEEVWQFTRISFELHRTSTLKISFIILALSSCGAAKIFARECWAIRWETLSRGVWQVSLLSQIFVAPLASLSISLYHRFPLLLFGYFTRNYFASIIMRASIAPLITILVVVTTLIDNVDSWGINHSGNSGTGTKCERLTVSLCRGLRYNLTAMPNFMGHTDQLQAERGVISIFFYINILIQLNSLISFIHRFYLASRILIIWKKNQSFNY